MKIKNIPSTIKNNIIDGWRSYFEIKVTYDKLGIKREDYITDSEIVETLGLVKTNKESGFVNQFIFIDEDVKFGEIPLTINMHFDWAFEEETKLERNKDVFYYQHEDKFYTINGSAGFVNPKYDEYDEDYNSDDYESYWLDKDGECSRYDWELTKDSVKENHIEVIKKLVKNEELKYDFYGNCNMGWINDEYVDTKKYNDLCVDISNLSEYSKTNYFKFTETHVHICFAIRYNSYVKPFTKDFKKLVKKHNLKNWLSKQKIEE